MDQAPFSLVDHSAIRTNQAVIILLVVLSFIFNLPALVGLLGAALLLGTLAKRPAFGFLYQRALKPLGWVRPDVLRDHPEPHRFAQGFGSAVLLVAAAALWAGASTAGWALAWLVAALAGLNLFAGFCAGCAMYYWLNRLHVPGFAHRPPEGVFPGMRPGSRG
ncbi:MAG: DUF4395 domain-containing protein [Chloroflexi bacterium]|jgi:hypothetical protein|nr:DUF4395 domain-containing protein [Chloroflexota bacterium]